MIESRRRHRYKFSFNQVEMLVSWHFEELLRSYGLHDGGHIGSVGAGKCRVNVAVVGTGETASAFGRAASKSIDNDPSAL
jgi:hypothetical protein